MLNYSLGNVHSKERAEKIKAALQDKTYFSFKVSYGIFANNYPVVISSAYDEYYKDNDFENDFKEMITYMLALSI
jgi:hypothetical protein